jgi:AcrR family transcriptional regulator
MRRAQAAEFLVTIYPCIETITPIDINISYAILIFMARPKGTTSGQHEARRAALLDAIRTRLVAPNQTPASLRELAAAAGVTIPTLRHYFGKREELVAALLEDLGKQGTAHIAHVAVATLPFAASITDYVAYVRMGFRFGLAEIHTLGLREGLRQNILGPAYLNAILEPTIQSLEAKLQLHQDKGDMRHCAVRVAALQLLSPLILVFLHQQELCGDTVRPIDIDSYCAEHVENFVRCFGIPEKTEKKS